MQASKIIMIRPCSFGYNEETADSNKFQSQTTIDKDSIQNKALAEFDNMVKMLRSEGIDVIVYQDQPEPHTPDSIFPNNWFATHEDGTVVLFPMEAENRRLERREDLINDFEINYRCSRIVDFTDAESIEVYLEGTGSIVFDHDNRIAYACRSSRTDERLFKDYSQTIGYHPIFFDAFDKDGELIYHTNVLMNVGHDYIVICLEAIPESDRSTVEELLQRSKKTIIPITMEQMNSFAGNMLELIGKDGLITVLSQSAFTSLNEEQKEKINSSSKLVPIAIPTVESVGGGSVRCMMAEVFLEKL